MSSLRWPSIQVNKERDTEADGCVAMQVRDRPSASSQLGVSALRADFRSPTAAQPQACFATILKGLLPLGKVAHWP